MADYYKLLGIDSSADSSQIRAAYKRMAMRYHPDRNAGDKEAEEIFKNINEAYHVLSDSIKKSRYDARLHSFQHSAAYAEAYWRELQRIRYYQWRKEQKSSTYRIDKQYFKVQGLAFLVFIILSGFCFAIIHSVNYFIDLEQAKQWNENTRLLKEVNNLFVQGHVDEAFVMINTLEQKNPLEFRFNFARDSMVNELREMAEAQYKTNNFSDAARHLRLLQLYEMPVRMETLERMAVCQYHLGNYREALIAMKHLHQLQPWNIDLIYRIAMINLDYLKNTEEALYYFAMGEKLFKENLSEVYGKAFRVVMNPHDVPDIYFYLFEAKARTNFQLHNYENAVKDCNWAIYLKNDRAEPYKLRAIVNVALKKYDKACADLTEAGKRGIEVNSFKNKYCR